jgi:hypothetical protein
MDSGQFKNTLKERLSSKGFKKRGGYFYKEGDGIVSVIGLQKSNFEDVYYLNVGYVIKDLHPSLINPRDVDGDVRSRFSFEEDGKGTERFNLYMSPEQLGTLLEKNIQELVEPVHSVDGLKVLLTQKPVMLLQTTVKAKKFLGLE